MSPWATGGAKKAITNETPEEIDTAPKKLEWSMTPELKLAVVSVYCLDLKGGETDAGLIQQRFAETRLSDLICQNEAIAVEFEVYGKNAITRLSSIPYLLSCHRLTLF